MIRSFFDHGHGPLVDRTRTENAKNNDNVVLNRNNMGQFSQPEKIQRSSPRVQRNSLSPKKTQKNSFVQHFLPASNAAPVKIKLSPKMEKVSRSKTPVRAYAPRPQYPTQSSFKKSNRNLSVNINLENNQVFNIVCELPAPPLTSSSSHSVNEDVAWMHNPVFQKRSCRAATVIQASVRRMLAVQAMQRHQQMVAATQIQSAVRGFVQRCAWTRLVVVSRAAVMVQRIVRGSLVRQCVLKDLAAIHLQRMARGFVGRLRAKVVRLERLLATVKEEHQAELQQIQKYKKSQMKRDVKDEATKTAEKNERRAQVVHEFIEELRKSNRALREKNKDLTDRCTKLKEQNDKLEVLTKQCYGHIDALKKTIQKLQADQIKLKTVLRQFEEKRDKLMEGLRQAQEMTEFEQKAGSIYMKTIKDHILKINQVCPDKALAKNIYTGTREMLEEVKSKITAKA